MAAMGLLEEIYRLPMVPPREASRARIRQVVDAQTEGRDLGVLGFAEGAGQNLASSFNIAAFNLGNATGAWLGGLVIERGPGLAAITWVAALVTVAGLLVALWSVRIERCDARTEALPRDWPVVRRVSICTPRHTRFKAGQVTCCVTLWRFADWGCSRDKEVSAIGKAGGWFYVFG